MDKVFLTGQDPKRRCTGRGWRVAGCFLAVILLLSLSAAALVRFIKGRVLDQAVLEAGGEVCVEMFLARPAEGAVFLTNVASIDTSVSGTYTVEILLDHITYSPQLTIEDTIPPTGRGVHVMMDMGDVPPEAVDFVEEVQDVSPVTVRFQEEPEFDMAGDQNVTVLLTDSSGNTTPVTSVLTIIADTQPPVIEGTHDIEGYLGDTISYRTGIVVTDDKDEHPVLEIDNSQVDLSRPGTYPVFYRATDSYGNCSEIEITVTLLEKPASYVEPEVVAEMAEDILASITDPSMDSMQVAYAIYRWVKFNISYTATSDKSSWTGGAYQAFKKRSGDCFNYFAAAKALLDAAGIENMEIVKSDTSHSQHFWNLVNLGDGWYHFDCTPRKGEGDDFFLVTDAELEAYSQAHNNSHVFDPTLYPERSTVSVQDQIDYSASTLQYK